MRQFFMSLFAAVGMGAAVGGVCALFYGVMHPGSTLVQGLGALDGVWHAEQYCFLGGVLAAAGSALATFGFAMIKGPPPPPPH
jgi:hypothetical protein